MGALFIPPINWRAIRERPYGTGGIMPHTYNCCYIHYVFSTKRREPWITPELQERLFPYMGGVANAHNMQTIRVGGIEDHVHHLVSLPTTISLAKAIQLIKGNSSKWIHDTFPQYRHFEWQEGYGAFSISIGDIERTTNYIDKQAEHHKKMDFKTEFIAFLNKHEIEYDERFVFD